MQKVRLPGLTPRSRGTSKKRTMAHCFSTKSENYHSNYNPNYFGSWKTGNISALEKPKLVFPARVSLLRQIGICDRKFGLDDFVSISFIAYRFSPFACHRFATQA